MDPQTGALVELEPDEVLPDGYVSVPDALLDEAKQTAQEGRRVSLDANTPLSQFRRDCLRRDEKRKAQRRRNNKMARKARRKR
jgi:hypothetical protein